MRNDKGQFIKGIRSHPETEFKLGEHWRPNQVFRDKNWLYSEYIEKQRSTGDIAKDFNVKDAAILFWLRKHNIPRRSISEARKIKYWGQLGDNNPMWNGGSSSERQSFCNSLDWAWAIRKIYSRDKKTCQRCGRKQTNRFRNFHIHHRVSFKEKDLRSNLDNLILLCAKCHHWVHSHKNKNRQYIGTFQITLIGGDLNK
jgi:hypothetical protein